ncbi:MAG TPA: tripartite tricarboxylate transporter substrate binding protein [Burkholderiales bacterium]|nr:tripartite tricarboxylate transporter substrate binding protein [Burkholderiales bacterium]
MASIPSPVLPRRALVLAAALALALPALSPSRARAQAVYPNKTVTFIVPFAPGGGTDITARTIAAKLTAMWGGPTVVVENRGGAGGILGADAVAKARPDGHTLLIANVGTQSINPTLYPKLPYNPDTAFAPISLICELPFVLMASTKFAPNTVKELVTFAKANPDKVTYASSGSGGSPHLTAELFQLATGTQLVHVPYKGGGPAMTDLMAGHVDLLFASVLESSGNIKTGKLKGLAVTHAKRSPALPDVPTLAEAGVKNAESGSWIALLAPAGTPAAIVDKLAADVKTVVADPEVREKLIAQGAVPQASTPKQLQALIDADRARYGKIIRDKGLKVE